MIKLAGMSMGLKQTEIGEIPEGWALVPLGEAVEFLDGKRRPIRESDRAKMRGIYPYYGASGIVDYVNDYIFDEEPILLGEDGENILSRNLPLAFQVSGKIWVNNHAHVMRPRPSFNIRFLTEFLDTIDYSNYNSGTAQPKLNKRSCLRIPVVVPPLPEQRAIAAALSDADALIASLDALIAKKRDLKQAAMQQLLTGKTRVPGFDTAPGYKQTDLGPIPEDWSVLTLGATCSFENGDRGRNYPSGSAFVPMGIPFVNAGHLNDGRIARSQLDYITRERFDILGGGKFAPGDILFVCEARSGNLA